LPTLLFPTLRPVGTIQQAAGRGNTLKTKKPIVVGKILTKIDAT